MFFKNTHFNEVIKLQSLEIFHSQVLPLTPVFDLQALILKENITMGRIFSHALKTEPCQYSLFSSTYMHLTATLKKMNKRNSEWHIPFCQFLASDSNFNKLYI